MYTKINVPLQTFFSFLSLFRLDLPKIRTAKRQKKEKGERGKEKSFFHVEFEH